MSANDRQVAGTHYASAIQHWDYVVANDIAYLEAQVIKYLTRWRKKNGHTDVLKAKHFLDKLMEVEAITEVVPGSMEPTAEVRLESSPGPEVLYDFPADVMHFNKKFGLGTPARPTMFMDPATGVNSLGRLIRFKQILQDELNEVDEIIADVAEGCDPLDVMTDLADWLGDMQVYCASEMLRWGLPWDSVLCRIMSAQWSKLGVYGEPIIKDGKVVKGPNYRAPEAEIRELLASLMEHGLGQHATPTVRLPEDILDLHQNEDWQCEGFYGDGTQLYCHRATRKMFRARTLQEAYGMAGLPLPQRGG